MNIAKMYDPSYAWYLIKCGDLIGFPKSTPFGTGNGFYFNEHFKNPDGSIKTVLAKNSKYEATLIDENDPVATNF